MEAFKRLHVVPPSSASFSSPSLFFPPSHHSFLSLSLSLSEQELQADINNIEMNQEKMRTTLQRAQTLVSSQQPSANLRFLVHKLSLLRTRWP